MINLDGIFNALVEQWTDFPNVSQAQFAAGVESRGIATEDEANLYVGHFISIAVDLSVLDVETWDGLQARVQSVGIERASRAGLIIHSKVRERAAFRIDQLEAEIADLDGRTRRSGGRRSRTASPRTRSAMTRSRS
jgi:hypothetical protein